MLLKLKIKKTLFVYFCIFLCEGYTAFANVTREQIEARGQAIDRLTQRELRSLGATVRCQGLLSLSPTNIGSTKSDYRN